MTTSAERGKRAFDHLRMLDTIHGKDCIGRWVAISLADGRCDARLYGSKSEAIRFQLHETQCAYICLTGGHFTEGEIRFYLDMNERLYDEGLALADPDTYVNPEAAL